MNFLSLMREFAAEVLTNRERFVEVKLTYAEINRIQITVLNALNLKNLNELRDKFEGIAFYEEFSREIFGAIAIEKQ